MIILRNKNYSFFPDGYGKRIIDENITIKNEKTGETIDLKKGRDNFFFRLTSFLIPSIREVRESTQIFEIYKGNKKIGILNLKSGGVDGVPEDTIHISWIKINKEEEGNGYAQSIIKEVLKQAKKEGFKYAELDSMEGEVHKHLYPKLGFKYVENIDEKDQFFGCRKMNIKLFSREDKEEKKRKKDER